MSAPGCPRSPSLAGCLRSHFSVGLAPNFRDGAVGAFSEGSNRLVVRVDPVLRVEFPNRHLSGQQGHQLRSDDLHFFLDERTFNSGVLEKEDLKKED